MAKSDKSEKGSKPAKEEKSKKSKKAKKAASLNTHFTYDEGGPRKAYGVVTAVDGGYQIDIKRPRSSKADTFVVPKAQVLAASTGDGGYLIADNNQFGEPFHSDTITEAKISDTTITGKNENGGDVYINLAAFPVSVHSTPIEE